MAAKVNYGDNLYFVISTIRALRAGLQLEIDTDYFLHRIEDEIFFLDGTIEKLGEALLTNTFLINRSEHLRELMRAKRSYADLLEEILQEKVSFARHLSHLRTKLTELKQNHVGDIADIQSAMRRTTISDEPQNVVGEEEYRFLFQNNGEDEN